VKAPSGTGNFFAGVLDLVRVNWKGMLEGVVGILLVVYVAKKVFYIKKIGN
jgi:hypothetical protein